MYHLPVIQKEQEKKSSKNGLELMPLKSETFNTTIMTTEEAFLYMKVCMEQNGGSMEKALVEIQRLDDILFFKRLFLSNLSNISYTRGGNIKKKFSYLEQLDKMIDGYVEEEPDYQNIP
jgi:hypothetical protein